MKEFFKYQGLGNDFILVDHRGHDTPDLGSYQSMAKTLCDRHLGIGADGILLLSDSAKAAFKMTVINADGSIPEMCGNGIRCAAHHGYHIGSTLSQATIDIETGAGLLLCENQIGNGKYQGSKVAMGKPVFTPSKIPTTLTSENQHIQSHSLRVKGRELLISLVSMGNPHAVAFAHHRGKPLLDLATELGPLVETHSIFPNKTNVEFVHQVSPTELEVVVWERGCGITQACGTGATASAVVSCMLGKSPLGTPIQVKLPGGPLVIEVASEFEQTWMAGPAKLVFSGVLP